MKEILNHLEHFVKFHDFLHVAPYIVLGHPLHLNQLNHRHILQNMLTQQSTLYVLCFQQKKEKKKKRKKEGYSMKTQKSFIYIYIFVRYIEQCIYKIYIF